ncbi:hypothetical protein BX661DRAFT_170028 [Kickxella alabastrina]|uniref:uncharacterized protein n=1 Tax=Kickxella alabastrina TaxID=61397 RepID=UPI00221F62C9|nr:uncharacterized protein BX661DRAFT_170028 [Kickxella alabastrina]KAI7830823.1 hypothetical protein BX661DRAFT_170028 [Kickxella alabastrina]
MEIIHFGGRDLAETPDPVQISRQLQPRQDIRVLLEKGVRVKNCADDNRETIEREFELFANKFVQTHQFFLEKWLVWALFWVAEASSKLQSFFNMFDEDLAECLKAIKDAAAKRATEGEAANKDENNVVENGESEVEWVIAPEKAAV